MNKMSYYRIWKNLTQQEVANILGISKNSYMNYEKNLLVAKPHIINDLADLYNISPSQIYDRGKQIGIVKSRRQSK